jgi:hypothetical protein
MDERQTERFTDAELHASFERLFPHGFAGADVLAEIAPEGWGQSPLLTCFHPSVEQRDEEAVQLHRNIEALRNARGRQDSNAQRDENSSSEPTEPTLEQIRREYRPTPVRSQEEVTELVGLCLWDVFSDNHDVITAHGRVADIGSFRAAGAFLDGHLTRGQHRWHKGDYLRFYLGTVWISRRADLTPVYAMIFRRLRSVGADWVYQFPQLYLTELVRSDSDVAQPGTYSVSGSAAAELNAQKRRADMARFRAEIGEMNVRAREEAMDRPPPATVRAYRQVYRRDPRGWPPA